jgi:hypothetical protein
MKHTTGKWLFEQDGREPYVVCENYALGRICTAEGNSHESRANMHMAAAAPEMQRALISLLEFINSNNTHVEKLQRICNRAEMAIRKSKGLPYKVIKD